MTDEELVARLHLPWPKDESVDEVTLPLWVLELTAEAADRIEAQAAEIERLRGALQWCSGSADFNEGGIAREGWLTLCAPLLTGGKDE